MQSTLKIGLFGIGLDAYWPQFEGFKERLEGYLNIVHQRLSLIHSSVINAGLVDTADRAFEQEACFEGKKSILFSYTLQLMLFPQLLFPLCKRQRHLSLF